MTLDAVEHEGQVQSNAARAALRVREFRIIWTGAFASGIGTWMQNVTLGAFVYELTKSPTFVSFTSFAQLGPMLALSLVGGMLADAVDRRRLLLITQTEMMAASFLLAVVASHHDPSRTALLLAVFAVGVGNALNGPTWQALVPELVPRHLLSGAISLNSAQANAARVVGPAIGGLLYAGVGASWVFALNGATYLFSILSIWMISPKPPGPHHGPSGWRRLTGGLAVARRDPFVRRILVTLVLLSFFSLVFISQMPTTADHNLGLRPKSLAYGLLYACFGLGAVSGAVAIGTVWARADLRILARRAMAAFAVALATLALLRTPAPAYPVAFLVGFSYLSTITSLNTSLQQHVDGAVRGRVMALWMMGWGGTIPLGVMTAGPIIEATSITFVLLYGAVVAGALAWYLDLRRAQAL